VTRAGLTAAQRNALLVLAEYNTPVSSYSSGLSQVQLAALARKGLVFRFMGLGSIAMPRTAIKWSISELGRTALAATDAPSQKGSE
jgi:hypothetical protein